MFGLTDRRQIPLLLPSRFDDCAEVLTRIADVPIDNRRLVRLTVDAPARGRFDGRGPRITVMLVDADGQAARGIMYGPTKDLVERFPVGEAVVINAARRPFENGEVLLTISEIVPDEWAGKVRPVYPSCGKNLPADETRALVLEALPKYRRAAAEHLRRALAFAGPIDPLLASIGCPGWTLEDLIQAAHLPPTLRHGEHALRALERLAALVGIESATAQRQPQGVARRFEFNTMARRIAQLPHRLTGDQLNGLRTIYREMRKGYPARILLNGDVGTGKTMTFGAVAVAVLDEGGRVLVLVPNTVLVAQISGEIQRFWPDIEATCVIGDGESPPPDARFVVGTTAILHQDLGSFDLVIVDEQHKFAALQREHYVRGAAHLIEATATCIPRSLAIAQLGLAAIVELRETHRPKRITTRLFTEAQRQTLFAGIRATLAAGDQVLIVYPERGDQDPEGEPPAEGTKPMSVADAADAWERAFPGRVRTLTGEATAEEKCAVIDDLSSGRADILIATSVVEVGVNIPRLRQVIVVMPERHGLAALHQLRGRAAREGGEGRMDLYCPAPISPKSQRRLDILLYTSDGFEVAQRDLELRGLGNLARDSDKQSGADDHLIFNRPLHMKAVQAVLPVWEAIHARGKAPS